MLAIVMSGAANYGAMQAGALEVIIGQGIKPEMLVGTSAGALNAIFMAAHSSLDRAVELEDMWRAAGPDQVGVPKPFIALRRIVQQKDGLIDSRTLAKFLEERLPDGIETFNQLAQMKGIKAYVTAVDVDSGSMRVFGDNPGDRILDGAMSSSAVPPYFPPWTVDDQRYLDGGIYAKLPLCVAIERGATQIIALDVRYPMGRAEGAHGVMGVSGYSLSLMIQVQAAYEIAWARLTGVPIRVINLEAPDEVPFWDYTRAEYLIQRGREITAKSLEVTPLRIASSLELGWRRLRGRRREHPLADINV